MDKNTENKDWKNISNEFTEELQKEWKNKGFSYEKCKEWINVGLKVADADYAKWLRDIKKVDVEWLLNNGSNEQLKKEYDVHLGFLSNVSLGEFDHGLVDYFHWKLSIFDYTMNHIAELGNCPKKVQEYLDTIYPNKKERKKRD